MKRPFILIITGPCGAGKSTISKQIADKINKTAFLEIDNIRGMLGKYEANYSTYSKEAKKQIKLSMDNTISIGKNFIKKGYNVIIDDVLEKKQQISYYKKGFRKQNIFIILLLPNKKTLQHRDKHRETKTMGQRALELHDRFSNISNNKDWYVIDTSKHKVNNTVQEIIKIIGR